MRPAIMVVAVLLCPVLMAQSSKPKSSTQSPSPRSVHASALVIDTHADTPQRFLDENFDIGSDAGEGEVDLAKIARGNLGAEFFSIWVEPRYKGQFARRAFRLIDSVYRQAAMHPDKMVMAFSASDIEAAHRQHKFAALMGIEGGHAIENDLGLLRDFARLGVRYMTLTWSNTNEWADSSGDISDSNVQHHNGLTPFGRDVVLEMNRLGMMVDISHVADKTFWDTIEVSKAPVIASHSSARALTNAPRNMTDEMLKAVAKNGGVVMVNFYNGFLDDDYRKANGAQARARDAAIEQAVSDWRKEHPGEEVPYAVSEHVSREWAKKIPRPPLKVLIDHIDHVAKVAGVDHVGLGSDFDGVSGGLPEGMDSVADLPKITEALMARGYSASDVRKVLGGNLMRVFRQVEAVGRDLRGKQPEWHPAESAGAAPKAKAAAAAKK